MDSTIIVAVLALAGSLAGTYFANRKSAALIAYRLEERTELQEEKLKWSTTVLRTWRTSTRGDRRWG